MGTRLELQTLFEELLGSSNVFYQKPEMKRMIYPAIVYKRKAINNTFADNVVYKQLNSYEVIVIDADPDSEIVKKVSKLPMCKHTNHYCADNLNHDVFILYF